MLSLLQQGSTPRTPLSQRHGLPQATSAMPQCVFPTSFTHLKGHEFGSKKKGRSKFFTENHHIWHLVWENYIVLLYIVYISFVFWSLVVDFGQLFITNPKKLFMTFKHERDCLSLPSLLVCTLAFSPPSILWIWTGDIFFWNLTTKWRNKSELELNMIHWLKRNGIFTSSELWDSQHSTSLVRWFFVRLKNSQEFKLCPDSDKEHKHYHPGRLTAGTWKWYDVPFWLGDF